MMLRRHAAVLLRLCCTSVGAEGFTAEACRRPIRARAAEAARHRHARIADAEARRRGCAAGGEHAVRCCAAAHARCFVAERSVLYNCMALWLFRGYAHAALRSVGALQASERARATGDQSATNRSVRDRPANHQHHYALRFSSAAASHQPAATAFPHASAPACRPRRASRCDMAAAAPPAPVIAAALAEPAALREPEAPDAQEAPQQGDDRAVMVRALSAPQRRGGRPAAGRQAAGTGCPWVARHRGCRCALPPPITAAARSLASGGARRARSRAPPLRGKPSRGCAHARCRLRAGGLLDGALRGGDAGDDDAGHQSARAGRGGAA